MTKKDLVDLGNDPKNVSFKNLAGGAGIGAGIDVSKESLTGSGGPKYNPSKRTGLFSYTADQYGSPQKRDSENKKGTIGGIIGGGKGKGGGLSALYNKTAKEVNTQQAAEKKGPRWAANKAKKEPKKPVYLDESITESNISVEPSAKSKLQQFKEKDAKTAKPGKGGKPGNKSDCPTN